MQRARAASMTTKVDTSKAPHDISRKDGTHGHSCAYCSVRVSALALLKMAMHAKSGGNIEVMGMLQVLSLPCKLWTMSYWLASIGSCVSSPRSCMTSLVTHNVGLNNMMITAGRLWVYLSQNGCDNSLNCS